MKNEKTLNRYINCNVQTCCHYQEECDTGDAIAMKKVHDKGLPAKALLFRQGDPVSHAYILQEGLIKTFTVLDVGSEVIVGFHYPGDVIGLDCLYDENYFYFAEAITDCVVCFADKGTVLARIESSGYLSKKLHEQKSMFRVLSKLTARERLGYFIINHSQNIGYNDAQSDEFILGFTRVDIANYLGINSETISRFVGELKDEGILKNQGNNFTITNLNKLRTYGAENTANTADGNGV